MWIVRVARTRFYTFILLALLILMLSPLVILRTRNDIFPSVNIPAIAVARAAGIAGGEAASAPLRKIAELELPGPAGKRFDYLTIDEDDHYLLSAHLGAGLLHVIDLMIVPTIVVTTVLRITYLRTAAELTSPGVGTGCLTIRSKNAPAPIAVHLW